MKTSKIKKICSVVLAAMLGVSILTGCGSSNSTGSGSAAGTSAQEITFNLGADIKTLDPALNQAVDSGILLAHLFEGLYKLDENRNLTLLDEERVLKPVDAVNKVKELVNGSNNLIGAGTGIAIINEASTDGDIAVLESIADFPKAQYILTEGQRKFETGDIVEAQDALPLYVRNEVTWKKVSEQH